VSAIISADGLYRYSLTRKLNKVSGFGRCVFIMLNPSTADAERDDPTIRRCKTFTASFGCDELRVVNLFAFRATNPQEILWAKPGTDVIGPENDFHILTAFSNCKIAVAAWGTNGYYKNRANAVRELAKANPALKLMHLGLTKDGYPRHPLYVKSDTKLEILP
jgi:hypothetical protein